MALDRLVDNTKLNTALTATANAIRAKTGDNSQINFDYTTDTGFASAISDISRASSSSDAILIVTVPTGSTVTMTKGGVTLTPTMWVQAADPTFDCALFVIAPSMFDAVNAWTVTATRGTESAATTVLINSNMQYAIKLFYSVIYFDNGDQNTALTGGWTSNNYSYSGHGSKNGSSTVNQVLSVRAVSGSSSNTYGILGTENGIILGYVDAIDVLATIESYQSKSHYYVVLTTTKNIKDSNHVAGNEFTNSGLKTIDVSNLAKDYPYYISVAAYVTGSSTTYTSIFNVSSVIGRR